jgi:peptidoglycan/LPS O-acetylase OafA/YrhL
VDRRRTSLVLLLLFVLCTGISIVVSGSRPHLDQGTAPWLFQVIGYLFALAGAVLLIAPADGQDDGATRRLGFVVLGALVVLALLDAVELADGDGANIGAGGVRVVGLVVIMVATIRLAQGVAAAGRAR